MTDHIIRKCVLLATTAIAFNWAASAAQAQTKGDVSEVVVTSAREVALDATTLTGSRLGLDVRETPASIDVLTQERFLERGLRTSNEALQSAPGVTAVDTGGSPGTLSMRGFTSNGVSVNYDGVHQPSTMVNRNYDSFAFDRIEVLKGPASVLFGEGALGGAVNFVPKKPEFMGKAFQALAQYGSLNTYRVSGDANVPLSDKLAARAVVSLAGSDGYIDDTASKTTSANLGATYKPTDRLTVFVSAEYFKNDNGRTYWGTPTVSAAAALSPTDVVKTGNGFVVDKALDRANFQFTDGEVKSDGYWLRSSIEYRLNDHWKITNEYGYNHSDRLWHDAESYVFQAATRVLNRQPFIINNILDFWNERVMLNSDQDLFAGHRNRLAVGYEHSSNDHMSIRRFGSNMPVNPYALVRGVFPAVTPANFPGAGNFADVGGDITIDAVFGEDAFNLTDKWLLVGGFRYEDIKLVRTIRDFNLNSYTEFTKKYHPTSLRFGTVYDVAPKTQLFAQYSKAAAPVGTLVLLAQSNTGFSLTKGESVETGIKSSFFNNRVEMTAAGYWIRQTDIITRDPNNPNIQIQGGTQSSRGIELSVTAAITRQLRLDANYAVVNARFDELIEAGGLNRKGNSPTNAPAQVLNLFASYRFDMLPVTVTAGMRDSGHIWGDNANSVRLKGYTVFDASVSYRLPWGDLTLRGRNLGDELYAEWGGASQVYLAAPRTVDLTFRTKF